MSSTKTPLKCTQGTVTMPSGWGIKLDSSTQRIHNFFPNNTVPQELFTQKGLFESELLKSGLQYGATDEVGRGCIAGPVYSAAVILDAEAWKQLNRLSSKEASLIRDSKLLSPKQRNVAFDLVKNTFPQHSVGISSVSEIESDGIVPACFLAMKRACAQLNIQGLLIDGAFAIPSFPLPQINVIKGDQLCFSIAAASILAKVERDRVMSELSKEFPQYGFDTHMGYGTKKHKDALEEFGRLPTHRQNFSPVPNYPRSKLCTQNADT